MSAIKTADRPRRPWLNRTDVKLALMTPFLLGCSWLVPQRGWPSVARALIALKTSVAERLRTHSAPTERQEVAARRRQKARIYRHLEYLRESRPGGWRADITVENADLLHEAVGEGRGVILWVAETTSASLVVKKAVHGLGLRLHHVSRPEHGPATSRLGIDYLNAIVRSAEDRYLAERVLVHEANAVAGTRKLLAILKAGAVLSIVARPQGRQTARMPVAGGFIEIATGAPALANTSGAPILPVFCSQSADDRRTFRVVFDRRLDVDRDLSRAASIQSLVDQFGGRHQARLAEIGYDWLGYDSVQRQKP